MALDGQQHHVGLASKHVSVCLSVCLSFFPKCEVIHGQMVQFHVLDIPINNFEEEFDVRVYVYVRMFLKLKEEEDLSSSYTHATG